ncbi:MAG TPA: MXAN_2562 family outer membrane beta-barrel protein [Byssovorax sp.]
MRISAIAAALGAASALFACTIPAHAEEGTEQFDLDWRQHDRTDHYGRRRLEFPQWVFELRFGAYSPRVDSEPALGGATPYADVFGTAPQFYLSFELDWVPIRVPYVGGIGPGFGFGWTNASAKAKIDIPGSPNDQCLGTLNGCSSAEDTSLTIFPMYGVILFRVDDPMARWGVPIVPYVKLGVDAGIWTSGSSLPKTYVNSANQVVSASGTTWGTHFAIGGHFLLNWLDQDAVNRSREASGVRNFYAFGEFTDFDFATFGKKQLLVGSTSWVVGVAVDL